MMSVSDVIQSSACDWSTNMIPQKELNIKLWSTTPAEHIMTIFLDFRVQTNWPDFLAHK